MDNEDIHMRLFLGHPIDIMDAGKMYIPTLNEIVKLGEQKYMNLINLILLDKNKINNDELSDLSNFEILYILLLQDVESRRLFEMVIKLLFRKTVYMSEDGFFILGKVEHGNTIHQGNFSQIQDVLKIANMIQDEKDEYNPANERASKFIEKMKKRKAKKPVPKETISTRSLMSGLAWSGNGIKISDIGKMTIYQLYDGYKRIGNISNYKLTLNGIIYGTVDGKKINMSELNWAKIIN